MYAVVECGGQQFRVEPGTRLTVNKLDAEPGAEVVLDKVLLVSDESGVKVGTPFVDAKVTCTVARQAKGPKIHGFQFKPKKNIFRHYGHRQQQTVLLVSSIE